MGGRTIGEWMASMSAAEFDLWRHYYQNTGFAVDRIEWAVAKSGSAVAGSMGAKVAPADLIPKFSPPTRDLEADANAYSNWAASVPGVTVRRFEHEGYGQYQGHPRAS